MKYNFEALIPFLGGLYVFLVAKGHLMINKNSEANAQWIQKYGAKMKILGPFLMVFGALYFFRIFN